MYGRKREYSIMINADLVADYMESMRADTDSINDIHKHLSTNFHNYIDADDVWTLALAIIDSIDDEQQNRIADNYDCEVFDHDESNTIIPYTDDLIGHVADEILEECCRTVIEW